MPPGPRNLITDVPGILVGNGQDTALKSGTTCLTSQAPFTAGVDVRGGAPGTRETDLLAPDRTVSEVHAIVLSGGSAFGLDAAGGVMAGLRARGRGLAVGDFRVPIVPAAIVMDLTNGGAKDWADSPYPGLGRAAFDAVGPDFAIGTAGAGTGALTAGLKGGLGSASEVLASGATVGALAVVNAVGSAVLPDSRIFWAWPWEEGAEYGGLGPPPVRPRALGPGDIKTPSLPLSAAAQDRANTTIAIVATDIALDKAGCTRLAIAAQDGIARAIAPAHTAADGDTVFAVSTGTRAAPADRAQGILLEHAAATVLARAIARAVYAARPAPADRLPCWSQLRA